MGKTATKKNGRVHVLELRARNVKCIREVQIDLQGEIHEIRGDAGQGKTSILSSIEGALRGLDPDMVRKGANSAEIELHLTEATIKRIIPADRQQRETLMVTAADGTPIDRAKAFLETLCGPSAFAPVAWVRLGGGDPRGKTERLRQQRDQLLEALPLSLTAEQVLEVVENEGQECVEALEQVNLRDINFKQHPFVVCRKLELACYEHRKVLNAQVEEAQNRLRLCPPPDTAAPPESEFECRKALDDATGRYHAAKARQEGYTASAQRLERLRQETEALRPELPWTPAGQLDTAGLERTQAKYLSLESTCKQEIADLEEALRAKRAELDDAQQKLSQCFDLRRRMETFKAMTEDLRELEETLQGRSDEDLEAIEHEMKRWGVLYNARVAQDKHDAAALTAASAHKRAETMTKLVELFRDALPKALLSQADLPVEGLEVDEDKILINGIPLHQLGTSAQIRVGVLIAAALSPRAGFILVDGAESLGTEDRISLAETARERGLQLIMTYVDAGAKPGPGVTVMHAGSAKTEKAR